MRLSPRPVVSVGLGQLWQTQSGRAGAAIPVRAAPGRGHSSPRAQLSTSWENESSLLRCVMKSPHSLTWLQTLHSCALWLWVFDFLLLGPAQRFPHQCGPGSLCSVLCSSKAHPETQSSTTEFTALGAFGHSGCLALQGQLSPCPDADVNSALSWAISLHSWHYLCVK